MAISVSPTWLAGLPSNDFPVTIDPTATFYGDPSSGYTISTSNATNHSEVEAGRHREQVPRRRAVPLSSYLDQSPPWAVVGATLALFAQGGHTSSRRRPRRSTWTGQRRPPSRPSSPDRCWPAGTGTSDDRHQPDKRPTGHHPSSRCSTTARRPMSTSGWWEPRHGNGTTKVYGTSTDHFDGVYLELTLIQAPVATSVTSPANGSTIPTTTPTVTAPKVTDSAGTVKLRRPDLHQRRRHRWRSSTRAGSHASGTPSWTVPPGSLVNGTTYYVRVLTDVSPSLTTPRPPLSVNQFKVTLHLGSGGPSPTDTVGAAPGSTTTPSAGAPSPGTSPASVTVNMVTGNLSFSSGTHSLSTLSGPAGLTLSYNSLEPNQNGLLGQYFHTADGLHDFSATDTLVGQRIDPMVDDSWTTAYPPVGGLQRPAVPGQVDRGGHGADHRTRGSSGWCAQGGGMRVYEGSSSTLVMNDWSGTDTSVHTDLRVDSGDTDRRDRTHHRRSLGLGDREYRPALDEAHGGRDNAPVPGAVDMAGPQRLDPPGRVDAVGSQPAGWLDRAARPGLRGSAGGQRPAHGLVHQDGTRPLPGSRRITQTCC